MSDSGIVTVTVVLTGSRFPRDSFWPHRSDSLQRAEIESPLHPHTNSPGLPVKHINPQTLRPRKLLPFLLVEVFDRRLCFS